MSWCDYKDCPIKKSCYNMSSDCDDKNFLMIGHNILVPFVLKIKNKVSFGLMFQNVKIRIWSTISVTP